jgi:hypothetical protein
MGTRLGRNHVWLILAVLAVAALPLLGAIPRWGGLPPQFGEFPVSHDGAVKPGFSWPYFLAGAAVAGVLVLFLLAPALFGFHRPGTRQRRPRRALPWWFWIGLAVNLTSWGLHWWGPLALAKYTFIPLWWGFIFTADGIVYARTNGRSMFSTETRRAITIALVSIPGWGLFEFFNFYAVEFWVYPVSSIFSPAMQAIWFLLSFSVVLPAVFEWYTLLHTFDGLWNRWHEGPAMTIPRWALAVLLVGGMLSLVLFGAFPFLLFPLFWVGPPLVLTTALALLGFWTPFRPITHGNWSPVVLAGFGALVNGVFWELWNYGSAYFHGTTVTNPNYWYYDIPYVNRFHPFSEMPLLGYAGYLPYGFLAWVCWLVAAHILDLRPNFDLTMEPDQEPEIAGPI